MPLALNQPTYQRGTLGGQQPAMGGQRYRRGTQSAPAFGLQAQQPLTQAGALAQQQTTQGLQTGQFGAVQSAQNATNRANMLRNYQAIQLARGSAARGNLSAAQAQRGQDEAIAAASSSNLAAQNQVNALQRQYGQDALNRADTYENEAYGRARDERDYQTNRADVGYNRATDESRYADTRGDVMYNRGRQEMLDTRDESRYQDTRGDVQYNRTEDARRYDQNRADSRDDVMYGRSRDAVGDARYAQEYADSRGDIQYTRDTDASRYADTRSDLAYNRATDEARYQDTRGDVAYSRDYQAGRDAVADQRYADTTAYDRSRDAVADQRYDQTYADQRGDVAYSRETDATRYADTRSDLTYARDEAKRLEGKGDVENLISSVQDPRAQNLLRTVQAQGGDVQAAYQQMMDNGTIREEYRSASPGTQAYQAAFDELKAMYPGKTDAELQTMIQQDYETARTPLDTATEERAREGAFETLAGGATPTEAELGYLPSVNAQAIPVKPTEVNAWLANNPTGGWVKVGGTPYQVVGASNAGGGEKNDYTIMKDQSGKEVYMLYDRTITDQKPGGAFSGVLRSGVWG
jgi:hypothetical protein